MADTKTVFSTSSACRQNSKFTASIISPTTVMLTIHKSRSTSALSELQQEVRQYELATTTSSTRDGNDDSLHRSHSLPSRLRALTHHATQEAFVGSCEDGLLPGEHEGGEDTAERAESTAVASNSRVSQLEAEIQNTRMTVSTLEKTIHHMKVYIDTLERQLKDEAQNNELLKEELEASKKLCCELHEACSRGDMPSSKLSSLHLVNHVASVHRSVQTLQQVEQETEPARLPDQSHGIEHRTNGRPWDYEDEIETLENEIASLQQRCREKDYRVQAIAQQLSRYVHRDSYVKLEAKRASLESNLQRANRKARSLEQKQVYSKAFLDEMMWEMQELQDVKVSLSKENSGLKDQAARHVAEVSLLKEKLRCSNQECRTFKRKIDILNELLHNKQGEVTQKDTALETKNTILEAIKTIAYTSPSPVLSSNEWEDAEDVVEQHTSTDIGTHCDNGKAVNRRQSTTRRNGCDVGGHNARPSKTCNKPSFADNSRRVSCKSSYKYKDAVQADQQSEIYTSDTGSWETDTSGPYQVASSSSTSYQDLGEQETSHDRRNDFIDEEEDDNESLLDSELSLGEGECVKYGVEAEGLLLRKQEQENYAMRSRDRCWHYVYVVQNSTALMFYETREHKRRGKTLHDESPIDLIDALVTVAVEYTRRKHVFRVRLKTGKQYLFQARDDREMLYWVSCMDSAARCQVALTNGVPPSIASVSAPQLGSPSKSDRIKNAIKGSLSALIK